MAEGSRSDATVRLLLVRHGESEGNRLRQFSRDNDIDLTERGVEQARAAGRWISERFAPTRVVASPYHRTQRTARLLAEAMGHPGPIATERGLREREIGALAGAPYTAMRDDPTFDQARFWEWTPAGGESLLDVVERAAPVVDRLLASGEQAVVVSHGGVMLALRAYIDRHWNHWAVSRNCEILLVVSDATGRLRVVHADAHEESGGSRGEGTG